MSEVGPFNSSKIILWSLSSLASTNKQSHLLDANSFEHPYNAAINSSKINESTLWATTSSAATATSTSSIITTSPTSSEASGTSSSTSDNVDEITNAKELNNYWALLALVLVFGTAAGNILVCLAIAWERRLQNVTNYFLMSLAITDLMVAILVMPLGILTLVRGYFPLQSEHCLAWICLDVLFCTASIMHLCTISVDRYLSLRYPMRFGRNKTRRRVTLKIVFVWLLSIAMSLPLSLMYSKNHASVLVDGTCQIPDPVYKLVGSIVCFYIPLGVMLLTYCLTVRLLARQRQNLGGGTTGNTGWASGWLGQTPALERRCTWRRLLKTSLPSTPNHAHSAASTDTELSTLDNHELWLPDSSIPEPTPSTMTALHQFGAEMLKLSRGLESVGSTMNRSEQKSSQSVVTNEEKFTRTTTNRSIVLIKKDKEPKEPSQPKVRKRRASATTWTTRKSSNVSFPRKRFNSLPRCSLLMDDKKDFYELFIKEIQDNRERRKSPRKAPNIQHSSLSDGAEQSECNETEPEEDNGQVTHLKLPPPCTCPYFGDKPRHQQHHLKPTEVKIISTSVNFRSATTLSEPNNIDIDAIQTLSSSSATILTSTSSTKSLSTLPTISSSTPQRKLSYSKSNSIVTWDSRRNQRRGSSFGSSGTRTSLLLTPTKIPISGASSQLRRSATLRQGSHLSDTIIDRKSPKIPSSPCLLQRTATIRSHHSRNSSVVSRNSSRHGRIIRLEQKATKVLGVVFFTFVILWAPFFVLNLLPTVCAHCESNISHWVFDVVTWLGYASSMVNPIFYTIFNKVFRQAFRKVLLCQYSKTSWRPHR
ncbi:dopamine D2-like receptor [Phlebotomus argentipes]|uniref:dopamine D2-like receptor n=1 Tax=Phlebotomus argentipes TaxID=94469 RepID=UPI002892D757|nr:dopamine D2-like receptor [Phlebotomus argentipes]XP_059611485.1 dopamine D2-like receptor [Phlebotomus argentipes]